MVLPALNCETSMTRFYKKTTNKEDVLTINADGRKVWFFEPDEVEEVACVAQTCPTFIRINVPHLVDCMGVYPRASLLVDFDPNLNSYLEELVES
jgi:hypothetical protein